MSEERVERRLAAILAADVAGYSRLMGVDEEGTLAALKSHLCALVDPKTSNSLFFIVRKTSFKLRSYRVRRKRSQLEKPYIDR